MKCKPLIERLKLALAQHPNPQAAQREQISSRAAPLHRFFNSPLLDCINPFMAQQYRVYKV